MDAETLFLAFEKKMQAAGVRASAIATFRHNFFLLLQGQTGFIPENSLQAIGPLPHWEKLDESQSAKEFLSQAIILKLNGGLGTSMGLAQAKSLLPIKEKETFLDFIVQQFLALKKVYNVSPALQFLNSFSTSADTLAFLKKYPELGDATKLELMQNKVPKIDATTFEPAQSLSHSDLEWCPPGHGDLYAALWDSGRLNEWIEKEFRYLFISNADNIGATLDLKLLNYFAQSRLPFLMEVTPRTEIDRKGGHLCRDQKTGGLRLRELAQCPQTDLAFFQDIECHAFFNTNNLWVNLLALRDQLEQQGGFLPLPFIQNRKTLDPKDKTSPVVIQLETAVGAAMECFPQASAIVVPRSRFAPVKTTSDLLILRSDLYEVDSFYQLKLNTACKGRLPVITLDKDYYQMIDHFDAYFSSGVPSLRQCQSLTLHGPIRFEPGVCFEGNVTVANPTTQPKRLKSGHYSNQQITL
ncbi:MAG: UTP--glucose-1-phosphate uridylyltransferase [Verrucomicrobiia bacterium]